MRGNKLSADEVQYGVVLAAGLRRLAAEGAAARPDDGDVAGVRVVKGWRLRRRELRPRVRFPEDLRRQARELAPGFGLSEMELLAAALNRGDRAVKEEGLVVLLKELEAGSVLAAGVVKFYGAATLAEVIAFAELAQARRRADTAVFGIATVR
jgi:hypothetical protein